MAKKKEETRVVKLRCAACSSLNLISLPKVQPVEDYLKPEKGPRPRCDFCSSLRLQEIA